MLTMAHPWLLVLLAAPPVTYFLLPARPKHSPSVLVPFLDRVNAARTKSVAQKTLQWGLLVKGLVWALIIFALARPQWLEDPIERIIPTRDLLLLVDLSGSMSHEDFQDATGEQVDRLTAVKEVLGDFLLQREGDRVGLVVFGNSPFLQVPFSTDLQLSQHLLDETQVGMAGPRTALGDAIGLGIQLFENSDSPEQTIIALTDGNDNASAVPLREAARVAADREITVHTVAVGDPTTVGEEELDIESLEQVASVTGGDSFLALNREELQGIYDRLDEIETRDVQTVSHRPRLDLFYIPLAAALLVSACTALIAVWQSQQGSRAAARSVRIRVNPRSFELEAVDQ